MYKTAGQGHKKNARLKGAVISAFLTILFIQQEGRELQNSFCSAENRQPSVAEEMVR